MGHSHRNRRFSAACYLAAAGLLGSALVGWMLWPREVKLSADTYDLAVALYRVCNQQDPQGLAQVQQQLDEFTTAVDDEDGGIARLQEIIDDAEAGHWTMAMKQTRNALAAQVRRP